VLNAASSEFCVVLKQVMQETIEVKSLSEVDYKISLIQIQ